MKITKRQLRQIIKEEKAKLLKESAGQMDLDIKQTDPMRMTVTLEFSYDRNTPMEYQDEILQDLRARLQEFASYNSLAY